MKGLGATLLVLLLLAVVADFAAKRYAEGQVAAEVEEELGLGGPVEVSIGGFPFLPQVLGGRVDVMSVGAPELRLDRIELKTIKIELQGVRFSLDDVLSGNLGDIRVQRARGSAELMERALNVALADAGETATIDLRDDGAGVAGSSIGQNADANVSVDETTLQIASPFGSVELELPSLGGNFSYRSVRIVEDAAVLSITGGGRIFSR